MEKLIACDLSVFTHEERTQHEKKSSDLIHNAVKVKALKDGFAFYHDYSPEQFLAIATWIMDESKCCPFFTFELVLEPTEQGYELCLNLKGSQAIKHFLKSNFELRE
jgi:hypothetical protein